MCSPCSAAGSTSQNKKQKAEAEKYTLAGQDSRSFRRSTITDDDVKKIDKIVLAKAGEDGGARQRRRAREEGRGLAGGEAGRREGQSDQREELLDNLKTLKVAELIDSGKTSYDKFEVRRRQGPARRLLEGRRGRARRLLRRERRARADDAHRRQGRRLRGQGLLELPLRARRQGLARHDALQVRGHRRHGRRRSTTSTARFDFEKDGDKWKGKFKKPRPSGSAHEFDSRRSEDLLRAYKALNADGFAERARARPTSGSTSRPRRSSSRSNDGAKREVKVGSTAEGTSRWVQASGMDEIREHLVLGGRLGDRGREEVPEAGRGEGRRRARHGRRWREAGGKRQAEAHRQRETGGARRTRARPRRLPAPAAPKPSG